MDNLKIAQLTDQRPGMQEPEVVATTPKKRKRSITINFNVGGSLILLTVLLVVLKATNTVDWEWWAVLLPLWIVPVAICGVIGFIMAIVVAVFVVLGFIILIANVFG